MVFTLWNVIQPVGLPNDAEMRHETEITKIGWTDHYSEDIIVLVQCWLNWQYRLSLVCIVDLMYGSREGHFFLPLPLVYIPTVADCRRSSPKVAAHRRSETEKFAQWRKSSLMPCGLRALNVHVKSWPLNFHWTTTAARWSLWTVNNVAFSL